MPTIVHARLVLKVGKVIPMHFGTFPALVGTPAELSQRVADLKTEVWALQPGVPVGW